MLNLPPNHFDPGLTALIANRVFIMENPNGGIDIVFTDGAEHFQMVNMAVDIMFFKIISVLSHGCLEVEWSKQPARYI